MKELEDMRNDELFTIVVAGIQILRNNDRKKGYAEGYADGKANTPFTDTEEAEKKAYERGLKDAWECARKMCLMSSEERLRAFDVSGNHLAILSDLTASQCIEKVKAYHEEKQKCSTCRNSDGEHNPFDTCSHCNNGSEYEERKVQNQKCCRTCKHNVNPDELCKYVRVCLTPDKKDGLFGFAYSKYEPKQTEKSCNNCKYEKCNVANEPCESCGTKSEPYTNWQPKQTEGEINVGYEVYNLDRENKRIVTAIDGNKAIQLCKNGKYTVDNIDTLHWTGREDFRIISALVRLSERSNGEQTEKCRDFEQKKGEKEC